jgi:site-specific DNA-methyltransferase (adenine-specific)
MPEHHKAESSEAGQGEAGSAEAGHPQASSPAAGDAETGHAEAGHAEARHAEAERAPVLDGSSREPGVERSAGWSRVVDGLAPGELCVVWADNAEVLPNLADESFSLVYIDPPFNTGRTQSTTRLRMRLAEDEQDGDRTGFGGRRYATSRGQRLAFDDRFDDYLGFLGPRLDEARRILASDGALFVHLDWREVHYVKVALDGIFGRDAFMNHIVWAYDYGARSTKRWSPKHDDILWYVKDPTRYVFDLDAMERIPYMAPGLVGPKKAARGKLPTDTWWHTIVSPTGHERTGYPTQKPRGILERIVKVHSREGDRVLDFFAGSGSFGEVAAELGRRAVLVDRHPDAITTMRRRFAGKSVVFVDADGRTLDFDGEDRPRRVITPG